MMMKSDLFELLVTTSVFLTLQWLSAVVSLQTSIARHLAQKQIQMSSTESGKSEVNVKSEKPTASVQPVIQSSDSQQNEGGSCDSKVTSM